MSDSPILSSSPPEQAMGLEGVVTKSPPKAMSSDGEVPKSPPKPMISDDVATGSPAERTLDAPDEVNIDQPSTSTGVGARGPPVVKAGRPRHVYAVRESLLEIAAAYAQEDLDKKINEGKESEEAMKYLNDAKQLLDNHRSTYGTYHYQRPTIEDTKQMAAQFAAQKPPSRPEPSPKKYQSPTKRDIRGESQALKQELTKGIDSMVKKGAKENLDQFDKIVADYFRERIGIIKSWNQAKTSARRTELQEGFKKLVKDHHLRMEALYDIFRRLGPETLKVFELKLEDMFDRENEFVKNEFEAFGPAAVWFFMNQRERQMDSRDQHQTSQPKGQRRPAGTPQWL